MTGYQNKSCKLYHLPLHSQHAFEWISSYQVLAVIHTKKHRNKARYHNIPADNLRTVQAAFEREKLALQKGAAAPSRVAASKNKKRAVPE